MSIEVACANCEGRLLVETPGVVVACPHCGTHLMIPDPQAPAAESGAAESSAAESGAADAGDRESATGPGEEQTERHPPAPASSIITREPVTGEALPADDEDAPAGDDAPSADGSRESASVQDAPAERSSGEDDSSESPSVFPGLPAEEHEWPASFPDFGGSGAAASFQPAAASDSAVAVEDAESLLHSGNGDAPAKPSFDREGAGPETPAGPETAAVPAAEPAESPRPPLAVEVEDEPAPESFNFAPAGSDDEPDRPDAFPPAAPRLDRAKAAPPHGQVVSKSLFILVAGYASAVTLALLYLLYQFMIGRTHPLEHLPDVVPRQTEDGKIVHHLYPEDAPMPWGHTLQLGQTRRFGNLEVTPLRVSRGPVEVIYDGDDAQRTPPVLKLWLRFRNVSEDQSFAPLGRVLLYRRQQGRGGQTDRGNTFACRAEDKERDGPFVLAYPLDPDDGWDLAGQNVDRRLGPGEEFETFIATAPEGIGRLTGELLWRVHIRKGYNPESRWGVTTLFEVAFHSDAIEDEPSAGSPAAPQTAASSSNHSRRRGERL